MCTETVVQSHRWVESKGVVRVFGLFIILLGVGALGAFVCLLDAFEQAHVRRTYARVVKAQRERHEQEMAELWPQRLQRRVYDQDAA